ncbi:DivIVA domain-containing protein [Nocardioides daeguensis]|nr:DivIVA domain-containing protein [Nocardioides daeguensis]MCR1773884.1 DivIVA domain-containing protein [Nocardioides daeguensis]
MWVFAVLIVLAMGGVALLAAGRGEPMAPAYDDRPDALVPAAGPVRAEDLRRVRFSLALRGYRMAEVDTLLTRLAREMEGDRPAAVPAAAAVPTGLVRLLAEKWAGEHPAGTDILDFSAESVDQVESSLDQWSRRPGRGRAAGEVDVWAAGAYLGEVLVRAVPGAEWATSAGRDAMPVVTMPSGRVEDPIGKAMARFDGDEHDSVIDFVDAALAAET